MEKQLKGTGVAIITPFHNYGTVDFTSFGKVLEHVIGNGVNYIVALGTTGESVTLSKDEKLAVIDFVIDTVDQRVPVVIGVGGNNTQEVINSMSWIPFGGIDAILSVCPYYNKPNQNGIYNHYKAIAGASPVPVILYNVPGRTSCNLSAATTLKLAKDFKNIIGIKEASGNFSQIMEIIDHRPDNFLVISGDDALTLPLLAIGVDGVISVVANAYPGEFTEMVSLGLKSKMKKARAIHYQLMPVINALFEDGSPAGIKALMSIMGLCSESLRLPLEPISRETFARLESLYESVKFADLKPV